MNANITVSEPKLPQDTGSPLAFTMEGESERPPSSLVPFYWTPGWNSVQAMYNYLDEPNGSMKGGDPGIRLIERPETPGITYVTTFPGTISVYKSEGCG
jgi:NADH-quinone oxidoreductase subunit G